MRVVRIGVVGIIGVVVVGYSVFELSKSRTWQLAGGFVPRVATSDSLVALTFDDGPTPAGTETILAMLDSAGVKATFFLIGRDMAQHPEQTRQIVAAGHEIGNHTYTHPWLLGRSWRRMREEIEPTDALIREAGYTDPITIRTPYGKRFVGFPLYLWANNRTNIFFDVEPDSYPEIARDRTRIVAHVLDEVRPGSIILLHVMYPSRKEVLEAVPALVAGLQERGYQLVTVSELVRQGNEGR